MHRMRRVVDLPLRGGAMSAPLYVLTGQFADVQARAEAGEDVSDALVALTGAVEDKAAAIVRVLRDLELDSDKVREEQQRLAARRKTIDANVARLKEYLRTNMDVCGIQRVKAATFTITLSDGQDSVVIEDEAAIPDTYMRVKREPNKAAILDAYVQTGECVPGTRIERGTRLVIK